MDKGMAIVPPHGWVYPQALPNGNPYYLKGATKEELVNAVRTLRINLGIEVGDVEQDLDEYFESKKPVVPKSEKTLRERVTGWASNRAFKPHEFVEQDEAERRAAICVDCHFNIVKYADGCAECYSKVEKDLFALRQARGTSQDHWLGGCQICAHENKTAVHLDEKSLQHRVNYVQDLKDKAPKCWLLPLTKDPSGGDNK